VDFHGWQAEESGDDCKVRMRKFDLILRAISQIKQKLLVLPRNPSSCQPAPVPSYHAHAHTTTREPTSDIFSNFWSIFSQIIDASPFIGQDGFVYVGRKKSKVFAGMEILSHLKKILAYART
jgi:hypothetical protein